MYPLIWIQPRQTSTRQTADFTSSEKQNLKGITVKVHETEIRQGDYQMPFFLFFFLFFAEKMSMTVGRS